MSSRSFDSVDSLDYAVLAVTVIIIFMLGLVIGDYTRLMKQVEECEVSGGSS